MAETILCTHCQHRRVPYLPVPSCVSDPTNRERLHWREEWRKRTKEKRVKEDAWAEKKKLFGGEPWFYAWCDYKSREQSGARDEVVYQLAEAYYTDCHVDCPHYEHDPDADRPQSAAGPAQHLASAPTPARTQLGADPPAALDWENGGSF
jgi:hypothetical protein